ncbi:MAG: hypothetical protein ABH867_04580, partial [Patescibacteria group bacterium]
MINMALTNKQKKYIEKNIGKRGIAQIAKAINIDTEEIKVYLKETIAVAKYEKIFPEKEEIKKEQKKKESFNVKGWFLKNRWRIALLALLVIIAYANSINNDFLSDDINGIVENTQLDSFSYVLSSPFLFLHALIRYSINLVFGRSPAAFRLSAIICHLISVIALFFLLNLISRPRVSFFAAILFAVHPLIIESVTWISSGYNPYSAVLILISFSSFIIALEKKAPKLYLLSVFLYFLG